MSLKMSGDNKIGVTLDGMAEHLKRAIEIGKVHSWAIIALEWMRGAQDEVFRLQECIRAAPHTRECDFFLSAPRPDDAPPAECRCWKRDALGEG